MEPEFEKLIMEESVRSIRVELEILRNNPFPDPVQVEALISWIKRGVTHGHFTLGDIQTSREELHWFSAILLTH